MQIINDSFCSGLKLSNVNILLRCYRLEHKSPDQLKEYIDNLKTTEDKYNEFLDYKNTVEKRTPNLKEIYFEFLDGKRKDLDFELFSPIA